MSNINTYWTARENSRNAEIFTSPILAREMLDKIPNHVWMRDDSTFLDQCFGSGTFIKCLVEKLREFGHSDENISKRIWGIDISRKWYNRVKHFRVGEYNIENIYCDDSLNTNILDNMKFDVICGNPPYHKDKIGGGDQSGKSFWQNFVEISFDSLKDDGYLCMIHPCKWREGKVSERSNIYKAQKLLFSNQIIYLKTFFPFPEKGVLVDYYVAQKTPNRYPAEIDFVDCKKKKKLPDTPEYIRNYDSDLINSIEKRCFIQGEKDLKIVWGWGGDWENTSKHHSSGKYKWRKGPNILEKEGLPHIHHFDKKVLGRVARKVDALYDSGNLGIGDHNYYLLVKSDIEGKNLEFLWNSKLMIFFLKIYRTYFWDGDNTFWNNPIPFKKLHVPDDKLFKDLKDIYDYYGLSQKERDYIDEELNKKN